MRREIRRLGEAAEVPAKLILKFMCVRLVPRQSPGVILPTRGGAKWKTQQKILMGKVEKGGAPFLFSVCSVILSDEVQFFYFDNRGAS